jgi:hypothetical protein
LDDFNDVDEDEQNQDSLNVYNDHWDDNDEEDNEESLPIQDEAQEVSTLQSTDDAAGKRMIEKDMPRLPVLRLVYFLISGRIRALEENGRYGCHSPLLLTTEIITGLKFFLLLTYPRISLRQTCKLRHS